MAIRQVVDKITMDRIRKGGRVTIHVRALVIHRNTTNNKSPLIWTNGTSSHTPTQRRIDRSQAWTKHPVTSRMLNARQISLTKTTTRHVWEIEVITTRVRYCEVDIPKSW